jgi:GAF domain-containing protein
MKRRSRTGGNPTKGRARKAAKPTTRNPPKGTARSTSSSAAEKTEVSRLTRELNEALERQTAMSEALQIISRSPDDLKPVFQAMLKSAVRLCDAKFGNIYRWDGDALHLEATENAPVAFAQARGRSSLRPSPQTPTGRMIATKMVVHAADMRAEKAYADRDPYIVAGVELGGVRTVLMVPLLKDNELIGAFSVYRQEVRPFTDKQIALVQNFAAQAVIAIENARLLSELRQSLEQQTASSEVLQVISTSPGELEPVFTTMLEKAVRICDAKYGSLYLHEDGKLRLVAAHDVPEFLEARRGVAFEPAPGGGLDEAMRTTRAIQIPDLAATKSYLERHPGMVEAVELAGIRTGMTVPMLKDDQVIGVIAIHRREVLAFTGKQVELLTNFAAQAVIAIENARLLNELRGALERQTATSDVLQVISSSPGDLEPVFTAMLENAVRICDATFGNIYRTEGDGLRVVATHNTPPVFAEARRTAPFFTPGPKNPVRQMMTTKTVIHVDDVAATEAYADREPAAVASVELGGTRTLMIVPMLREAELVGACMLARQEVRRFSDKQIELVTNFAAQAVIAIENARLLNELRQSLEQQTATSQVLQVISSSPGDLEQVFATILQNATRICEAKFGALYRSEGDGFRAKAMHNAPPAYEEARAGILHPPPRTSLWRAANTKQAVQIADVRLEQGYIEGDPFVVSAVALGGYRSVLNVPMLHEDELVGVITIFRQEVRPFTEEQISLVKNFAAQAVIAIENARLLSELRQRTADLTEALEQQTATSEVLRVISSSPSELDPVFQTMLTNAARLCEANFGTLTLNENNTFRVVALHNAPKAFAELRRLPATVHFGPKHPLARQIATKQVLHIADVRTEAVYIEGDPSFAQFVDIAGPRTLLNVPMLKDNEVIGTIGIYRKEVRPFSDKQIELLQNFAAQAVIAIENARLLKELRERTEQVEAQSHEVVKLNQQLERRVADQVGEIERMGRLRRFLPPQVADLIVASGSEKQLESHRREITALFCDLRGFTGFTESADAEDVMALLRDYHAAIGELVIRYSGTLERYAGDGVMVVFNDPVPVENPALQAVLMALELRNALGALTQTWSRLGHEIGFGIGIAHGFATLGTIGYEGRFDYAAIGTVSNVASRLCDEAKPGQILISPRVLTKVENAVKVEPVGEFELKGIRRPLAAYNVVGTAS